ncbi:hypothetical protein [Flavobacterium beibuense]|uniref:hypothetical protein n=1 Tax=Flavobacterium beibuense TaxID=657326 RepID=UPI003A92DEF6
MTFEQKIEKHINLSGIIIGTKINALYYALSDEQKALYLEYIENAKADLKKSLANSLTDEEWNEVTHSLNF